jgi:hypothetical protein
MRAKVPSHANTTLGKFPNGVPLENLLSRRAARLAFAYLRPEPMLELAKGFEPLTL